MKAMDLLKALLGSKLDEDIDIDMSDSDNVDKSESIKSKEDKEQKDESTKDKNVGSEKTISNKEKTDDKTSEQKETEIEIKDSTGKEEVNNMAIFEEGWFDSASGKINFDKIKNDEVLAAIKVLNDKYVDEKNQRMINDSINDELKNYKLAVSDETFRKVLDMSGIKVDADGKVTGVKEALDKLKSSEPTFFKDVEKESNPLNEGFSPVDKQSNSNLNSFSQAFRLMEE